MYHPNLVHYEEAVRYLEEAIYNLKDYPNKGMAQRAFGYLSRTLELEMEVKPSRKLVIMHPDWLGLRYIYYIPY